MRETMVVRDRRDVFALWSGVVVCGLFVGTGACAFLAIPKVRDGQTVFGTAFFAVGAGVFYRRLRMHQADTAARTPETKASR